jgi:hypothetical protein
MRCSTWLSFSTDEDEPELRYELLFSDRESVPSTKEAGRTCAGRLVTWGFSQPETWALDLALSPACQGSHCGFWSPVLPQEVTALWFQWKYGHLCKYHKPHDPRVQPGNFSDPGIRPDVLFLKDILQLFTGLILSSWRQWPGLSEA